MLLKQQKNKRSNKNIKFAEGSIVIYRPRGREPMLEVKIEKETVWLDAHQMARIFGVNRPAVVKHINNIYKTGMLAKKSTCSILEQVNTNGIANFLGDNYALRNF